MMPSTIEKPDVTRYTITELAREFTVSTRTIRFYEDQGLLNPRREGRKRVYSKRDRTRLRLTLRGKRLGFTLGETRELIDLFDTPRGEEKQLQELISTLSERRKLLEQQQRDIRAVLNEIDIAHAECARLLAEPHGHAPSATQPTTHPEDVHRDGF
jgi:DNA-binding transcriptional MerR regulator